MAKTFKQFGSHQRRFEVVAAQVFGDACIKKREIVRRILRQRLGQREEGFSQPVLGRTNHVERQGFARLKRGFYAAQFWVHLGVKGLIQKIERFLITLKLAQDRQTRDDGAAGELQTASHVRRKDLFGALIIADRCQRQRLVIYGKWFKPLGFADLFKGDQRGAHVALTQLGPSSDQTIRQGPNATVLSNHIDCTGVVVLTKAFGHNSHLRDLAGLTAFQNAIAQNRRPFDIAQRQV